MTFFARAPARNCATSGATCGAQSAPVQLMEFFVKPSGERFRGRAVNLALTALLSAALLPARLGGRERSEEHTSELQSLAYLVCRLLLEKKKKKKIKKINNKTYVSKRN